MQQRREEIAAKKARLAEMRKQREARANAFAQTRHSMDGSDVASPSPSRLDRRAEIDSLVSQLVDRPGSTSGIRSSRPNSVMSAADSNASEMTSPVTHPNISGVLEGASGTGTPSHPLSESQHTSNPSVASSSSHTTAPPPPPPPPPPPVKEIVTYNKEVQTVEPWYEREVEEETEVRPNKRTEEELRERIRNEIEEELKALQLENANNAAKDGFFTRELSEEEKAAIYTSEEFMDFVERSSKVVERALDEDYDVLADYGMVIDNAGEEEISGRRIKEVLQFYDERWSKKRMISDLHFSPKFPELMLAAYTKNPSAPHDPDGLVQIWNMHLHSRPEFVFHAQSDVLTARFSPFHPNLVIGGAYSGQVMIWDTRAKSQPVLKTPLTGSGHTHPVYSIAMVGTQNANNILSCSTDGVVCSWTVDMLAQPQEFLELTAPPAKAVKTDDLSPTCMAFPLSDPTYFLVGTEEGSIYPCHRYDRAGAKAGVEPRIFYSGHTAPVMSVDFHPARGPIDLGDLVLSSSLDWSVKIWKARPPASTTASAANAPTVAAAPILDLSREDVVYDAKWNPVKPGMFGLVDGAGQLELWDITSDIEVPWVKASPTSRVGATLLTKSLNKLAWEEHEGKKVAVGGLDGMVTIFDVAFDAPRNEEWSTIKKLTSKADGNVANPMAGGGLGGNGVMGGQGLAGNGQR
ncbi:WD40 repeat-like protein [Ascobolus immersus RN42]|uniref:WD40 repeat-like protein n=1 Tax=Ascobolus immersus RN42 TaxID=1160509 RepID=A0A3N4HVK9_ASCIM|nr:WD40 repeat-like protein [Ascobolus immersus RN42]